MYKELKLFQSATGVRAYPHFNIGPRLLRNPLHNNSTTRPRLEWLATASTEEQGQTAAISIMPGPHGSVLNALAVDRSGLIYVLSGDVVNVYRYEAGGGIVDEKDASADGDIHSVDCYNPDGYNIFHSHLHAPVNVGSLRAAVGFHG